MKITIKKARYALDSCDILVDQLEVAEKVVQEFKPTKNGFIYDLTRAICNVREYYNPADFRTLLVYVAEGIDNYFIDREIANWEKNS